MYVVVSKYNKSSTSLQSKLLFLFITKLLLFSCLLVETFGVWFDTKIRRGNIPDGGYDKAIWKHSRELLIRRRKNATLRRGGEVPQWRYWVSHLGLTWDVVETY